jgi:hypothetical protein
MTTNNQKLVVSLRIGVGAKIKTRKTLVKSIYLLLEVLRVLSLSWLWTLSSGRRRCWTCEGSILLLVVAVMALNVGSLSSAVVGLVVSQVRRHGKIAPCALCALRRRCFFVFFCPESKMTGPSMSDHTKVLLHLI